jgi:hypothetical protein
MTPRVIYERHVRCPYCDTEGYYEGAIDGDVCTCFCGKIFIFKTYKRSKGFFSD